MSLINNLKTFYKESSFPEQLNIKNFGLNLVDKLIKKIIYFALLNKNKKNDE